MSTGLPDYDFPIDLSPEQVLYFVLRYLLRPTNGLAGCIMLFEKPEMDIDREEYVELARRWLNVQKSLLVSVKRYLKEKYPDKQYNDLYFGFKGLDDV